MNENQQKNPGAPGTQIAGCPTCGTGKTSINHDVLKWVILGLLVIVVVALVFGAGIFIGERKARFSYRWAEQYQRNFAGPRAGFFTDWRSLPRGDFLEGNGVFGSIIKIEGNTLIIKGQGDIEKVVLVNDKTSFKAGMKDIKISDLKVDDWVVIIGNPNEQGQIEARLIRLFNPLGVVNPPREPRPF